jgi:hypothetical protein
MCRIIDTKIYIYVDLLTYQEEDAEMESRMS